MPPAKLDAPSRMEVVSRLVHQTLNDSSVKNVWGATGLAQWDQKRRVVWVRAPSIITEPSQAGGRIQGGEASGGNGEGSSGQKGTSRWRATRIRQQTMDLHIYAEHELAVDALLDAVIAAIDLSCPQVKYVSENWTSESPENAGHTHRPKVVLQAIFRLTVADEVKPLQAVIDQAHECGLLREDGSINSS